MTGDQLIQALKQRVQHPQLTIINAKERVWAVDCNVRRIGTDVLADCVQEIRDDLAKLDERKLPGSYLYAIGDYSLERPGLFYYYKQYVAPEPTKDSK